MATVTKGELILTTDNAVAVFEGGLDDVLMQIEKEVRSHAPDISTDKGRKAIASLAYKVAQSKTALDDMGKNLVAEWKAKSSAVDAERRRLRDRLDALKDEVRRPLTEWENAEKQRIAGHEAQIAVIVKRGEDVRTNWQTMDIADMKWAIGSLSVFDAYDWEEFHVRGEAAIAHTSDCIKDAMDRREKHDAEQEELARLRQEAAERAKREHEERIAKEAEERARCEAELKAAKERQLVEMERRRAEEAAKAEKERLEREKQEAIDRAERIERERVSADLRAKKAAEQAAEAERQRVEREHAEAKRKEAAADAAAAKRKAVRSAITKDIKGHAGIGHDYAEAVMKAIVSGKIRFVKITA